MAVVQDQLHIAGNVILPWSEWAHKRLIQLLHYLDNWLCHSRIGPSPAEILQACRAALQGPVNCYQYGEIRPQGHQEGSVPWNFDLHHPREVLSNRLLDYQILGRGRQVPSLGVSSC